MKIVLLCAALVATPVQAELYRWIDPESGSVKYSTSPPYDTRIDAQVVPFKAPAAPPPPPAASTPASAPLQQQQPGALSTLEATWSDLLKQLAGATPQDFRRAGEGLKQQLEAYGTLSAELDRLDPAGAQRRREQSEPLLERLKKGLAAQLSPSSPVPQKK